MCSLYKATSFWWIYTAKTSFFFLPSYNHNLRANIIFQHFASSFLLIQLKVKTINCYAWITSDFVSRWILHSEGENNVFLRIFLGFVFSAWSAVLLCIPSEWQPAFSKYYCVRWHSWDCAKLVPWAGQYAWHTCHLLAPDKDYECWTQTHGTIARNPIYGAETHPGRR